MLSYWVDTWIDLSISWYEPTYSMSGHWEIKSKNNGRMENDVFDKC